MTTPKLIANDALPSSLSLLGRLFANLRSQQVERLEFKLDQPPL